MPRKHQPDYDKPISIEQARAKFQKAMADLLAGKNPGPQSFRLKPTKKPGELYPLRLTQQQRESLIHCTRLRGGIKKKIEEAGGGTQIVGVTRKELDELNDETGQAALYVSSADKKRLMFDVSGAERGSMSIDSAAGGREGRVHHDRVISLVRRKKIVETLRVKGGRHESLNRKQLPAAWIDFIRIHLGTGEPRQHSDITRSGTRFSASFSMEAHANRHAEIVPASSVVS